MQQNKREMINKTMLSPPAMIMSSRSLLSIEQQTNIDRTRRILLVLITILMVLCSINFIVVIHNYANNTVRPEYSSNNSSQLVLVLISMIYYAFGFFITYRCYQTGLLMFAWLGFASLLLIIAVLIVILIEIIVTKSHLGYATGLFFGTLFIVVGLTTSLLQIITVRYALILSKLLKNGKQLPPEPV